MATISTPRADAPAVSPAARWTRGARVGVAVAFIAGGVLWVIAELIGFGLDGAARLNWAESHQLLAGIGLLADILAVPCLLIATLAWYFLARSRSPRLALTGALMLLFGLTAQSVSNGVDNAQFQIAMSGKVSATELAAALGSAPVASVPGVAFMIMFYLGAFAGIIVLMIAVWRSRTLPRTGAALVILFQLSTLIGLPIPATVLAAAGLIIMAISLLRTPAVSSVTPTVR
ncbi:hypothetical protein [Rathayibacter soli]|uniref:hypothetical protein n=1 Tax=Rathayibacter soli TaxID=3144168 RepID=UPI0027E50ACC|nr:hypothetical protein [Glaciibacter superstes]